MARPDLVAFSAEQVRRLTGLSEHQLRYWDRTEFFHPQYAAGSRAFGRIYSFRDVVGLRAIAILRIEHGVSLQELRKVGRRLLDYSDTPWASLRLYVLNRRVYFEDPATQRATAVVRPRGQTAIPLALGEVERDTRARAAALRERQDEDVGRIVQNRYVMHNAPVVAGTRVSTEAIWNFHQAGYSAGRIVLEYPRLTERDVRSALEFERRRRRERHVS